MSESDFDRRVRQIAEIVHRRAKRDHSDDDLHHLAEEGSPTDFEELLKKYNPGGVGQGEWVKVQERLREQLRLVPGLAAKDD
jgi:hypothetical protein